MYPVLPTILISGSPPALDEIIATLEAIASKAAKPKLSADEGSRNRSE